MALHVLLPDPIINLTAARREWAAIHERARLGVGEDAAQRERIATCWVWLEGIRVELQTAK